MKERKKCSIRMYKRHIIKLSQEKHNRKMRHSDKTYQAIREECIVKSLKEKNSKEK